MRFIIQEIVSGIEGFRNASGGIAVFQKRAKAAEGGGLNGQTETLRRRLRDFLTNLLDGESVNSPSLGISQTIPKPRASYRVHGLPGLLSATRLTNRRDGCPQG